MKGPSCETIPGETPIPHKGEGAGGLSYFSSGSVGRVLCWPVSPEANVFTSSKTKQTKELAIDTPRCLQPNKRIAQHKPTSSGRHVMLWTFDSRFSICFLRRPLNPRRGAFQTARYLRRGLES